MPVDHCRNAFGMLHAGGTGKVFKLFYMHLFAIQGAWLRQDSYALSNINFQTFSRFKFFPNDIPRSNASTVLINNRS